jgi:hypothetical protein
MGKKLRVVISFNYRHNNNNMFISNKVNKRGHTLATTRMLIERNAQIDAEEDSTGQPSDWRFVYEHM